MRSRRSACKPHHSGGERKGWNQSLESVPIKVRSHGGSGRHDATRLSHHLTEGSTVLSRKDRAMNELIRVMDRCRAQRIHDIIASLRDGRWGDLWNVAPQVKKQDMAEDLAAALCDAIPPEQMRQRLRALKFQGRWQQAHLHALSLDGWADVRNRQEGCLLVGAGVDVISVFPELLPFSLKCMPTMVAGGSGSGSSGPVAYLGGGTITSAETWDLSAVNASWTITSAVATYVCGDKTTTWAQIGLTDPFGGESWGAEKGVLLISMFRGARVG